MKNFQRKNYSFFGLALHWQILIGMILGVGLGLVSREFGFAHIVAHKLFIGDIFLRALKMVIVPLIVSSIITGVAQVGNSQNLGRLGAKTFVYYISTSLIAILTGLVMVNLIQPGVGAKLPFEAVPGEVRGDAAQLAETLLGIVPTNPVQAMVQGDMLAIIFFSLLVGFFITRVSGQYQSALSVFFQGFFEVMMRLTHFIILFAPLGVFGLTAATVSKTGASAFAPLASYMATVLASLLLHGLITLPLIVLLVGRVKPLAHIRAMLPALLTAFSTASSSATLPLTMECVEKRAGVSNKITSFVLPLGATINMDGTALYECVAAVFIAQVYGIDLSFGQQFVVVITALLVSIGAAGIPMAGLVMMTIVLNAVGLPDEGIGYIIAVDRILDMARTTVNVWSDMCGAVVVARTEGERLLVES